MSRNTSTAINRFTQIIADWVVIGMIFAIYALVYRFTETKICSVTCTSEIFMDKRPETIPIWAVLIYGTVTPPLFIIVIEFFNARLLPKRKNKLQLTTRVRKFLICSYHGITVFALGIGFVLTLTTVAQKWVRVFFLSFSLIII